MHGAGANELMTAQAKPIEQVPLGEHLLDGHGLLKAA